MATLSGKAEVAINGVTIDPSMLSEVTTMFQEGTRTVTTLGGTFTKPSGSLDSAEATFTLYLPSMDYLKNIFPARYNDPSAPQTTGNIIINADTCSTEVETPVNIHYTCEANDNNDIHIYAGLPVLDLSLTYNPTDVISIPVRILAQPDVNGNVGRIGTGDLTQESYYDATTSTTQPVPS